MKKCTKCKKQYPATKEFFCKSSRLKSGMCSYCKNCQSEKNKKYKHSIGGKIVWRNQTWKKFGIKNKLGLKFTFEDYKQLLLEQEGRCAVCNCNEPGKVDWSVDHDHSTGIVRGILCCKCNRMLGLAKDDFEILKKASEYIKNTVVDYAKCG